MSLLESPYLPSIALIAPAYNEAKVVIESVRSLISVNYFKVDIVIVNDGSKDDTLQILIDGFDLKKIDREPYSKIETKPVRGVYKSTKKAYSQITVIDKENGRKADAINVGINYSWADYYAVIDLDCILEPYALLRLVEPILKAKDKKVVAVGGVIGATNDSLIKHGKLENTKAPKKLLPRIQIIEYIRAFILGRPAWNSINGLLIISGALGIFERSTLIAVGGYDHDSIGEDMDLVMKMHKYCLENKISYKIEYVPFPLCWTEVPDSNKVLGSQRNRWMRGTIECMLKYRKMMFNPKYGTIGLISYPYWFFAELMAPIIEAIGIISIIACVFFGIINLKFAVLLFTTVYLTSLLLSFLAISLYYFTFRKYNSPNDLISLFKTALLEPLCYHPMTFYWSIKGYKDYFSNSNIGWGEMTRTGFKPTTP